MEQAIQIKDFLLHFNLATGLLMFFYLLYTLYRERRTRPPEFPVAEKNLRFLTHIGAGAIALLLTTFFFRYYILDLPYAQGGVLASAVTSLLNLTVILAVLGMPGAMLANYVSRRENRVALRKRIRIKAFLARKKAREDEDGGSG